MSTKMQTSGNNFFEKTFKLKEHKTNVKTEVIAGITTFMTMAYILVINPMILSETGMDINALFTATALSAGIATLVMAFLANYPFALAPGMGLNAFFAYYVVINLGYSWQFALTAILIEGVIFLLLTLFNVREAIVNCIPMNIKHAVSVGIGLFIALIGFKNAGIVVSDGATLVTLGNVTDPAVLLALVGIIIVGALLAKKVKGALLIGMLVTTVVGIPLGVTPLPKQLISTPPSISPIFMQFEFANILTLDMLIVVFTFLFVDLFDTLGTLIGVASKTDMLDQDGKLPKAKQALFADAIGTTVGACLGTSTVTTYVESASGVAEGGRTGLTALTTGTLFFVALFFSPIFLIVPAAATAPVLILVGLFMLSPITKINLDDYTEAIPAFLTIVLMPFTFSIAEGIIFGIMSYAFLKLITGKGKQVSPIMYVLTVIFAFALTVL